MGERIRAFDWASTPVGRPEIWPQSLRLTVRLMLNSQHPMFIWWGEELIQFYNDGYKQTMGPEMHPAALGARGRECWADIWPIIGPQVEHVMAGKGATWHENQMVPIHRHGGVQEVWWTYGYSPIDLEGSVGGILVVCTDVTEQNRMTEELRTRNSRLAQLFEEAPGFMAILRGPEHVFELVNGSYRQLIGDRDVVGKPVRDALPEVEGQGFVRLLDEVRATGQRHVGWRTPINLGVTAGGSLTDHFVDLLFQPIVEPDGTVSGIFVQGQDVTEHVRVENKLELINRELQHRVKNMLATIGAVASQTFRGAATAAQLEAFQSRLRAFAAAQEALIDGGEGGELSDVIRSTLAPHAPPDDRVSIAGPRVRIGSTQAVSVALAFHELATNALKYGSLSGDAGRVDIGWSVDREAGGSLHLSWRESGGPPVSPPSQGGFGTRLIHTVLTDQLGGEVDATYTPEGLTLTVSAPKENLRKKA